MAFREFGRKANDTAHPRVVKGDGAVMKHSLTLLCLAVCLTLPPGARADPAASALLNQSAEAAKKTQALSADFTYSVTRGGAAEHGTGTMQLMKPYFVRVIYHADGSDRVRTLLCDGASVWDVRSPENFGTQSSLSAATDSDAPGALLLRSFFDPYGAAKMAVAPAQTLAGLHRAGSETVSGTVCRALVGHAPDGTVTRLDVGPDGLVLREAVHGTRDGQAMHSEFSLMNVQHNPALTAKDFAWGPLPGPRLALADPKSLALLEQAQAATRTSRTLTADWRFTVRKGNNQTADYGTLTLMKPNYCRIGFDADTPFNRTSTSDGAVLWTLYPPSNIYEQTPVAPDGSTIDVEHIAPLAGFYDIYHALRQVCYFGPTTGLTYAGPEQVGGVPCQVVEYNVPADKDGTGGVDRRFAIGPDGIIYRTTTQFVTGTAFSLATVELTHVHTGTALTAADFAFVPPPGAVPSTLSADAPLLAAGTIAPDFTLPNANGAPVRLSGFKGHPVVLVFWSTWWSSGPDTLAQVGDIARRYAPLGVPVLAVHIWGTVDKLQERLAQHPQYAGPIFLADAQRKGQDAGSKFYGVTDVPTEYVIGKDGKIAAAFHGPEATPAALENALKDALRPAPAAK